MNQNESLLECAIREIKEEVNMNIGDHIKEDQFIRIETIRHKIVNLFILNDIGREVPQLEKKNKEIDQIHWVPIHLYI